MGDVFTGEELEGLAGQYSGEELEGLLGSGSAVNSAVLEFAGLFAGFWDGYSDDEVQASAFLDRNILGRDSLGIDVNDVSTPTGAFCWVVLRLRSVMPFQGDVVLSGGSPDFNFWLYDNLRVWLLEREAVNRGVELWWETGSTDNRSLRRFLLQATSDKLKDVIFSGGLPAALRPAAESLYDFFERLLGLEVYRVRPKIEEISSHPDLTGMTAEDVRRVWPEILELELDLGEYDEYVELFQRLEEDEVRGLLNSECRQHTYRERVERACPPWVREALSDPIFALSCTVPDYFPRYLESQSDCIFGGCLVGAEREEDSRKTSELFGFPAEETLSEPFEGFLSVSAGLDYACGARPSGIVWCWNWWSLLHDEKVNGDSPERDSGFRGGVVRDFLLIEEDSGFGCAIILDEGMLKCWRPRKPMGDLKLPVGEFRQVSVGIEHACAVRVTGRLTCWRIDPENTNAPSVPPPAGEFVSVDTGWDGDIHKPKGKPLDDGGLSCGLRIDAAVECWGEQSLVFGKGSERGDEFADVSVGHSGRICVLRTDGVIHCGEDRVYGSDYPPGNGFTQVNVGGLNHVCGLRSNGAVECWKASGEFLGSIPGPFTELEVGYTYAEAPYACGLLEDRRILCWDLVKEVFNWAAEGLEDYKHPQCFPDFNEGHVCWTDGADPPRPVDDVFVLESPILLPHSGSALYPGSGSN